MIEIRELYKYYGDRRAVGPVSASIESGEIVGLLGLNGAGKTTTLRVLACDLLPTSGTVLVEGVDVVERPDEVRQKIGYLPETPPLYLDMRVEEYLGFCAKLRGVASSKLTGLVSEVVELTELGSVRDQLIATLSHGYRQRVGIAQAIVHKPKLVILDEPISGLDPKQIVEMRDLVRNLRGEHTVLISSHILSEISETCDRILVIRDGAIAAAGTERELFAKFTGASRVDLTVRKPSAGAADAFTAAIRALEGVTNVELLDPLEPGEGILSARVTSERDVRDVLCRTLVGRDYSLLGLSRSDSELESVFLQLSGAELSGRRKRKAQGDESGPPASDAGPEASAVSEAP